MAPPAKVTPASPKKRKKRRGPSPADRRYLESRCQRCGSSLADALNAPVRWDLGLCSWCEHQWTKLEKE